ncbi:PGF-CTERM sorting domain-containing protein [Shewanella maritima]
MILCLVGLLSVVYILVKHH